MAENNDMIMTPMDAAYKDNLSINSTAHFKGSTPKKAKVVIPLGETLKKLSEETITNETRIYRKKHTS